MIIKYKKNDNMWVWQDNVIKITKRLIKDIDLLKRYDISIEEGIRTKKELSSCNSSEEEKIYKLFFAACDYCDHEGPYINLIKYFSIGDENDCTNIIRVFCKNENIVLITNQPCFLLNDEGRTIERLV